MAPPSGPDVAASSSEKSRTGSGSGKRALSTRPSPDEGAQPPPSKRPKITDEGQDGRFKFIQEDIEEIGGISVPYPRAEPTYVGQRTTVTHWVRSYVDTRKILLAFAGLCDTLHSDFHTKPTPIIHGDLTPTNLLVVRGKGLVPIDPMSTPIGTKAPGGTLEWAAPEQIVGLPVTAASDLYSVALMVVSLLKGVMYGEVTEFVKALKEKHDVKFSLKTVKLIKHPELSFDNPIEV